MFGYILLLWRVGLFGDVFGYAIASNGDVGKGAASLALASKASLSSGGGARGGAGETLALGAAIVSLIRLHELWPRRQRSFSVRWLSLLRRSVKLPKTLPDGRFSFDALPKIVRRGFCQSMGSLSVQAGLILLTVRLTLPSLVLSMLSSSAGAVMLKMLLSPLMPRVM